MGKSQVGIYHTRILGEKKMNTTLLKTAFENNLKIDLKLAENIITIARGIDTNLADEMEETLKQETRKGMAGYDYSVDSNIVGSDLDIRNHETFDASQVANCVICRKPLTNKKSHKEQKNLRRLSRIFANSQIYNQPMNLIAIP